MVQKREHQEICPPVSIAGPCDSEGLNPASVPVEILRRGSQKWLSLFVFLKRSCRSGTFSREEYLQMGDAPRKHVRRLVKEKWIGFDGKTYFLRSWKWICRKEKVSGKLKAKITEFNAATRVAVAYSVLMRWRKRRLKRDAKLRAKGISLSLVANYLGCSKQYVSKVRRESAAQKLMYYRHVYEDSGLSPSEIPLMWKCDPELARRLVVRFGKVYEQKTDAISVGVELVRERSFS